MDQDLSQIKLSDLSGFFSRNALQKLEEKQITNLQQLFEEASKPEFMSQSLGIYEEVYPSTKLLRCKYLNEDPVIEEDSNLSLQDTLTRLGLSPRTKNCIIRSNIFKSTTHFFEVMRSPGRNSYLTRIRSLGKVGLTELNLKLQIVFQYHDNQHKSENSVEGLREELKKLTKQVKEMNARITFLTNQIQELEQSSPTLK